MERAIQGQLPKVFLPMVGVPDSGKCVKHSQSNSPRSCAHIRDRHPAGSFRESPHFLLMILDPRYVVKFCPPRPSLCRKTISLDDVCMQSLIGTDITEFLALSVLLKIQSELNLDPHCFISISF